jgi:hypothetical protein
MEKPNSKNQISNCFKNAYQVNKEWRMRKNSKTKTFSKAHAPLFLEH